MITCIDLEFSEIMTEQNRTQRIESLADELEFYDQADDNIEYEMDQEDQFQYFEPEKDKMIDLSHKFEEDKTPSTDINQIDDIPKLQRKNTGTSGSGKILYELCPRWLEGKDNLKNINQDINCDEISPGKLKYLLQRDPMKEFFSLTAQAVKLSSPYMDVILTLPINQMYGLVSGANIPFYKWSEWIDEYMHKTILSKIYAEAFQKQLAIQRQSDEQSKRKSISQSSKYLVFFNLV